MRFRPVSVLAVVVATAALATALRGACEVAAADPLSAVSITGAPEELPVITVTKPVSVKSTVTKVVTVGDGEERATKGSTITLNYTFVNGRTGAEVQSSNGQTRSVPLDPTKTRPFIINSLVEQVGAG